MLKSGEQRRNLYKKGDLVIWRHWYTDYNQYTTRSDTLIEDRGVILKVYSLLRTNRLPDGTKIANREEIRVWKATVLFTNGTKNELPLVCLVKI